MDEPITDERRMSFKGTPGTTPVPSKVGHTRREFSLFSSPSMVRPMSHLSDASKDVLQAGKTLEPPSMRVTTLGKSDRINATVTTPPSITSTSNVATPRGSQMRDVDFFYTWSPGGQVATCDKLAAIVDVGHRADAPGKTLGNGVV
jgi:hypothetical protein